MIDKFEIDDFENDEFDDEFKNDDENLLDEIIDDKFNDDIITHVFSRFKKKHVVDAFFYFDVLILDEKYSRFIRHQTRIVLLIKIDQIQKALRNVKRV